MAGGNGEAEATLPGHLTPEHVTLDLRGLKCPLPALRTRKALARAAPGTVLTVSCTDPLAVIDIPHLVSETGHRLEASTGDGRVLTFVIRVASGGDQAAPDGTSRRPSL